MRKLYIQRTIRILDRKRGCDVGSVTWTIAWNVERHVHGTGKKLQMDSSVVDQRGKIKWNKIYIYKKRRGWSRGKREKERARGVKCNRLAQHVLATHWRRP